MPTLLNEVDAVAELSLDDDRWANHLLMIGDELNEARHTEALYLVGHPKLRASIDALVASIREKVDLRILRERVQIVLGIFGSGPARWCENALELARGSGHEKDKILHRFSTLATHILNRGLEEELLSLITPDACCDISLKLTERINALLKDEKRTFRCFVALEGDRGDLVSLIANSDFNQAGRDSGIRQDEVSRVWQKSNADRVLVSATYYAFSRRMAVQACLQSITTLLNVQNLYHNSAQFKAHPRILVYDGDDRAFELDVTPAQQFGLFPRSKFRKLSRDTRDLVGKRLHGRLANALEYHALALSADDAKVALINLWTALETITGSIGVKAVGTRVADRIAPIIAHRRVDKITTYLALCVHGEFKRNATEADATLFPSSNREYVAPDDVLSALTGPADNGQILSLFKGCSGSPHLVNRLFTTWQQFHDHKELVTSIQRSRRRIEWQIARIYRTRNLLVHRGEASPQLWRLLRNAQYYISSAISRVLHDLREQSSWTVDTSLEHQLQRYEYVVEQLVENKGQGLLFSDLLTRRTARHNTLIWPTPPPAAN